MRSIASKAKRVFFARFSEEDDLLEMIASTAKEHNITSGFFFLIGTLKKAILGFYKEGKYLPIEKDGPLEIVSCIGNISTKKHSEIVVHGHIVVSDSKGNAYGGHLLDKCIVDATAELVLVEVESGILRRELDTQRNLYLWSLNE